MSRVSRPPLHPSRSPGVPKALRNKFRDALHAFTLMELLIVIAVVGILAGIVIYAINPFLQIGKARDAERYHTANQLEKAMVQRLIDKSEFLNGNLIPTGLPNAKPICAFGITIDATCVNLDGLIPDYIAAIPKDSAETNPNYTGYSIYKEGALVKVIAAYVGVSISSGAASSAASSASATLVGYWKMDENGGTNLANEVGGAPSGTISGFVATWYTNDLPPFTFPDVSALALPGYVSNISIPGPTYDFNTSDAFSVTVWIKPGSSPMRQELIATTLGGSFPGYVVTLDMQNHRMEMALGNVSGSAEVHTADNTVIDSVWHHLAVTYDGSGQASGIHIYINGTDLPLTVGSDTLSGPIVSGQPLIVGGANPPWMYYGQLDDLRIYGGVLSQAAVTSLAAGNP